jgi:hypothetical protein
MFSICEAKRSRKLTHQPRRNVRDGTDQRDRPITQLFFPESSLAGDLKMAMAGNGCTTNRIALALGILLSTAVARDLRAETPVGANQSAPEVRKDFAAASIHAQPGLQCKLYPVGSAPSAGLSISTDDDGYARFHALRATDGSPAQRVILDCKDANGKESSYSANLASEETFVPRPVNIANERGIDRPALRGDPVRYPQAQLLQEGYGLRPDPEKDPAAYSRWLASASAPGKLLLVRRVNPHVHTVTTTTANPWAGSVLTGAPNYVSVEGIFNVPRAIPGGDRTTSTGIAVWNGLGGFGTGSGLIQGGIQIQTSPVTASYQSFREYCCGDPDSNGYGGDFTPNPGDQIYSQQWYCDSVGNPNLTGGYGCSFIHDMTSGAILSCTSASGSPCWSVQALPLCTANPSAPNCMTVGPAAEFIVENTSPQILASSTAFTDFTPALNIYGSAFSTATGRYSQTISSDRSVFLLTDFTNTTTHLNVVLGTVDETCFSVSANPNPAPPPPCLPAASAPARANALDGYWGSDNSQHVNYVAGDGHIHEMYIHPGAPWVNNDLTAFAHGVLAANGSALDGYWGSDNSQHVNFIARDGHVHELYIHPRAGWVDNDLTIFARGTPAAINSSLDGYWGSDSSQHVNFVAVDGHIHELYIHPGAGWVDNDLSVFARGTPAVSGSALDGYWGSDNSQHVNFVAADGHIHELYIRPGAGWADNDLTNFARAVPAAPTTRLDGYWGSDSSQHVNFVARDGHVHELYIHPGAPWVDNDLTAFARGTAAAAGSKLDGYWGSDSSQHVNFVAANGRIHELYIRPGAGWVDNDLTGFSEGIPATAGSALDGYWGSDSSQHVNYVDADGHVHELYIHPGVGWVDNDLTVM